MKKLHLRLPLLLASQSPRRAELLRSAGLVFRQVAPDVPEDHAPEAPAAHVRFLARKKAEAVASRPEAEGSMVLAADTVVVLGERILGKPGDRREAEEMLSALSGRWHEVYTGFVLLRPDGQRLVRTVATRVHFRDLRKEEILAYLDTREWVDKAGAYGIQAAAAGFVDRISGSYTNVVGLPLAEVLEALWELDLLEVRSG